MGAGMHNPQDEIGRPYLQIRDKSSDLFPCCVTFKGHFPSLSLPTFRAWGLICSRIWGVLLEVTRAIGTTRANVLLLRLCAHTCVYACVCACVCACVYVVHMYTLLQKCPCPGQSDSTVQPSLWMPLVACN